MMIAGCLISFQTLAIMRMVFLPLISILICLMRAGKALKVNRSLKSPVVHLQEVAPVAVPIKTERELKEGELQALKRLATRMFPSVVGFLHSLDLLQLVLERLQVLPGVL